MQLGQLVTTETMPCQTDQLFSGLGLSSYVVKKDSGSIATKMLASNGASFGSTSVAPPPKLPPPSGPSSFSLEQKHKWLKDSENLQRLTSTDPLAPSHAMVRTNSAAAVKDLTDSLMASNISKISTSQTFSSGFVANSGSSFQSPSASVVPGQAGFQNFGPRPVPSGKLDLSGFDSLLPMTKPKQTLNDIKPVASQPNYLFSNPTFPDSPSSGSSLLAFNNHHPSGTKPLSASEINDLLS